MLVLALVWWAWSAFVWAANAAGRASARCGSPSWPPWSLIFVAGLAVPHAYGDEAPLFAVAYAGVRLIHLALYADASRRGNASWAAIAGFAVTVLVGMALLVSAPSSTRGRAPRCGRSPRRSTTPGRLADPRAAARTAAGRRRPLRRALQPLRDHLPRRVDRLDRGGRGPRAPRRRVAGAVALGTLIVVALWWTYFDRLASAAEARLRAHPDPVLAAADSYSYLHLPIVAGIIVFAVGAKALVAGVGEPLGDAERLAFCGGLALYLAGLSAFQLRLLREGSPTRLLVAVALLVLYLISGGLAAWALAAIAAALMAVLCVTES